MATQLLITLSHSLQHNSLSADGIDAALTALVLGIETKVLFLDDGVALLEAAELTEKIKHIVLMDSNALAIYCENDLQNPALPYVQHVNATQARALFQQCNKVLNF